MINYFVLKLISSITSLLLFSSCSSSKIEQQEFLKHCLLSGGTQVGRIWIHNRRGLRNQGTTYNIFLLSRFISILNISIFSFIFGIEAKVLRWAYRHSTHNAFRIRQKVDEMSLKTECLKTRFRFPLPVQNIFIWETIKALIPFRTNYNSITQVRIFIIQVYKIG